MKSFQPKDMAGLLHHLTRQRDGMTDIGSPCNSYTAQVAPVHDGGVEYVRLVRRQNGPFAGMKQRIIFEAPNH